MPFVEIKNINKIYDNGHNALKNINLNINSGEFIVLLGPSGCGKSTLLRVIAGLEEISKGEIFINDKKINNLTPSKRNIGMVFQNYALYPSMNVFQNLEFPLKILKLKKDEIKKEIDKISELLNLNDLLHRFPKELSGGQRQRVALGRAMIKKPNIFLFDEPLSNLDSKLRTQIRKEIVELHRKINATSIYVTHDQTEAMTMADKIVIMNNGEIQQIGSPLEIYHKPNNLFVAKFLGYPEINVIEIEKYPEFFSKFINLIPNNAKYLCIRPENIILDKNKENDFKLICNYSEFMGYYFVNYSETLPIKFRTESEILLNQEIEISFDWNKVLFFDNNESFIGS